MPQENNAVMAVLLIKGVISELPAGQMQSCLELAEHIRQACRAAGEPVGTLAIALVGAEAQAQLPD